MKVLMAVHNYPPEFVGGVERSVVALAQALRESGHDVRILTGSETRFEHARVVDEEYEGIPVHRLHRASGYNNAVDMHDPLADAVVENVLLSFKPDVFHVHHWFGLTTGLVSIAASLGIPAVVSLHDYWSTCALFFRMPEAGQFCTEPESLETCQACLMQRRPMEGGEMRFSLEMRFAELDQELRLARSIIVSGQKQLRNLAQLGRFPRSVFEKVRIEPLGVVRGRPADRFEVRARSAANEKLVVAHWGNLSPMKGVLDLIEAIAASPDCARIKLKLIGAPVHEDFETEILSYKDRVDIELIGAYDAVMLDDLLQDADIAAFPSRAMETHSIVVDEALIRGMPLIVSDRGAMAERVRGRGLVVAPQDIVGLTAALSQLMSAERRQELADAVCQDVVTAADFAEAMLKTYGDVLEFPQPERGRYLCRDRLAFRNHRLAEIAHFVGLTLQRNQTLEAIVLGNEEARAALKAQDPDMYRLLAEKNDPDQRDS